MSTQERPASRRPLWRAALWGAGVGAAVGALLAWTLDHRALPLDATSTLLTLAYCAAAGVLAVVAGRLLGRLVHRTLFLILFGLILLPPALWVAADLLYSLLVNRSYALWNDKVARDADGVRLDCREYTVGDGDTALLLVHGFVDSPALFRRMAPALAKKGFTVKVMRLPGAAQPLDVCARVTADDWVRAVRDQLEGLRAAGSRKKYKRVVVVAHSLGAAAALECLAERPDLADGLVMMAPMLEISTRRSPWLPPQTWQEFLDRTLLFTDRLYVPFPPQVHDPVAQAELKDERYMPRAVYRQLFALLARNRGRAAAFRQPLLMLLARDDAVIDNAAAERFFDDCPADKSFHWLEDSGHVIPLDYDWPEAVRWISRFARAR
jgi:esterase/lipase